MTKMVYIGNDMQFGVPLLIVLGTLFTLWTSSFASCAISSAFYLWFDVTTSLPIIFTLLIVIGSNAAALYYGVKLNNLNLVRAWYTVKIIECVIIVVAMLCYIVGRYWRINFGLFAGLLLIPFGVYLILCVKNIYKNMISSNSIYQETIIEPITKPKI